jgi:hypothetical protein
LDFGNNSGIEIVVDMGFPVHEPILQNFVQCLAKGKPACDWGTEAHLSPINKVFQKIPEKNGGRAVFCFAIGRFHPERGSLPFSQTV